MQNSTYKTPNPKELTLAVPSNWSSAITCTQQSFPNTPSTTQSIAQQKLMCPQPQLQLQLQPSQTIIPAPEATETTPNTQQADEFRVPVNAVVNPLDSQYPQNLNWNLEDYKILTPEIFNALPIKKRESLTYHYYDRPVFRHPEALINTEFKNTLCILPRYKIRDPHSRGYSIFCNSITKQTNLTICRGGLFWCHVFPDTTGTCQTKVLCISFDDHRTALLENEKENHHASK